jgi:hypothetical protein
MLAMACTKLIKQQGQGEQLLSVVRIKQKAETLS